jgi:hypothetical protein
LIVDHQVIAHGSADVWSALVIVHYLFTFEWSTEAYQKGDFVTELVHPDCRAASTLAIAVELIGAFFNRFEYRVTRQFKLGYS